MTLLMNKETFIGMLKWKSKVKISEINNLIEIRDYVNLMINNFNLKKEEVKELSNIKLLIDKKIVDELLSDNFKKYINFDNIADVKKEAIANNTLVNPLKSSLK